MQFVPWGVRLDEENTEVHRSDPSMGDVFMHYENRIIYEVVGTVTPTRSMKSIVRPLVYKNDKGKMFVTTVDEFMGTVLHNGVYKFRFNKVRRE